MTKNSAVANRADLLIVTVTKVESLAVMKAFKAYLETPAKASMISGRAYHDLGVVNGVHVYMARSEMGSSGIGSSQEAVRKGIEALNPFAVIMVGIAFGVDENKQNIGDVLVSAQLHQYELQRVGFDQKIFRGDKVSASSGLLSWLKAAELNWSENEDSVRFGLILSGEKLIDNKAYRDELLVFSPEAIGGEMEGGGLYVACQEKKVDWILIKAICDWADGNKSSDKAKRQQLAANNAASFILHALKENSLQRSDFWSEEMKRGGQFSNKNFFDSESSNGLSSIKEAIVEQGENAIEKVTDLIKNLHLESNAKQNFSSKFLDAEVLAQYTKLRKGRFFPDFDCTNFALRLANDLEFGELRDASNVVRCTAMSWCARVLTRDDSHEQRLKFLSSAKKWGEDDNIKITAAIIDAVNKPPEKSLQMLANIQSSAARTASFLILSKQGFSAALNWLDASQCTYRDLDFDGKTAYLKILIDLGRWDDAYICAADLSDSDFEESPILLYLSGLCNLSRVVPPELRQAIAQGVPFELDGFPLASTDSAIVHRKKSIELFARAVAAARDLACQETVKIAEDYALWLSLRDPQLTQSALIQLRDSLRENAHSLRRLHFALKFGLPIDIDAVEREIARQTAISGGLSQDAALARFSIGLWKKTPLEVTEYIAEHREQLYGNLSKFQVQNVEIDALVKSGAIDKAQKLLSEFAGAGMSVEEQTLLQDIIKNGANTDPTSALRAEFEQTNSLIALKNLVNSLYDRNEWRDVSSYSEQLFSRTESIEDAERLAYALTKIQASKKVIFLIRKYPEFLNQSTALSSIFAWSLYWEGETFEAKMILDSLRTKRNENSDRMLFINIAITTGDWDNLLALGEEDWKNRESCSPEELIQIAQIIQVFGAQRAKELTFYAASRVDDDSRIFLAAYSLATKADWESEPEVSQWLLKASDLSSETGPVQKIKLADLLERAPAWRNREIETMEKLCDGSLPMFVAASLLNKTLVDMILFTSYYNLGETDLRKKSIIPAFSGNRVPLDIMSAQSIAVDASALLTLCFLGKLETLFTHFSKIVISHSTLNWLFEEKTKVLFHQPSQIRRARELALLLSNRKLDEFALSATLDQGLSIEVGEELASLIAEAQSKTDDAKDQISFVIRMAPVHRPGSLMEEEADLSGYVQFLRSSSVIVKKLYDKGQITLPDKIRADSYLNLHEREWPAQSDLPDGAILYLDDISVTHLQHMGLLGKLKAAGLHPFLAPSKMQEIKNLLNYEALTAQANMSIDTIRIALHKGISNGAIKIAPKPNMQGTEQLKTIEHPSIEILSALADVDLLLTDDRMMNKNLAINHEGEQVPVISTLDLFSMLSTKKSISKVETFEVNTVLRTACYAFSPITSDELQHYLASARIAEGELVETAELRAIREYLLRIRMSDFLQLPSEGAWFEQILESFHQTIISQWYAGVDVVIARARSDWLLSQIDPRGWIHFIKKINEKNVPKDSYVLHALRLLWACVKVPEDIRGLYWNWVESTLLAEMKLNNPSAYLSLIERVRLIVLEGASRSSAEELN